MAIVRPDPIKAYDLVTYTIQDHPEIVLTFHGKACIDDQEQPLPYTSFGLSILNGALSDVLFHSTQARTIQMAKDLAFLQDLRADTPVTLELRFEIYVGPQSWLGVDTITTTHKFCSGALKIMVYQKLPDEIHDQILNQRKPQ